MPAGGQGEAIGAHAVASPSRQCRRRAESPAGRACQRVDKARRSAPTPSRVLRGNAAGEPNCQQVELASGWTGRGDQRSRRREPFQAMPEASHHQLVALASGWTRRGDRRPRRREPFEAMPQASRVFSWSAWPAFGPGEAVGAHAVASPSRQCRRRAESSAGVSAGVDPRFFAGQEAVF